MTNNPYGEIRSILAASPQEVLAHQEHSMSARVGHARQVKVAREHLIADVLAQYGGRELSDALEYLHTHPSNTGRCFGRVVTSFDPVHHACLDVPLIAFFVDTHPGRMLIQERMLLWSTLHYPACRAFRPHRGAGPTPPQYAALGQFAALGKSAGEYTMVDFCRSLADDFAHDQKVYTARARTIDNLNPFNVIISKALRDHTESATYLHDWLRSGYDPNRWGLIPPSLYEQWTSWDQVCIRREKWVGEHLNHVTILFNQFNLAISLRRDRGNLQGQLPGMDTFEIEGSPSRDDLIPLIRQCLRQLWEAEPKSSILRDSLRQLDLYSHQTGRADALGPPPVLADSDVRLLEALHQIFPRMGQGDE